ncbi:MULTISPECIES: DUF3626 domain-containing protein [unclassified Paenibacillus]|uniref:DUF3626 domain-containing protein n=1 Tax=unclassified Paenibacillus TaxID=185978 RepID=UPI00020D6697|nr:MULTISPECIES: DUF3626 domain-containing protein [unclassified Paenibacillus]EGL17995.1 hypothetical protein HMPREF9413_4364 [Paenibacillus sp. HGF7]EPD81481.1 hypothetical protein HMPREF1207_05239 [Paenibacillus sp. HGH0039]
MTELKRCQERALEAIEAKAAAAEPHAREKAAEILREADFGALSAEELCAAVVARSRVTLNFHPDRLIAGGLTVAEGLLQDGEYRSQFETRISSGGLSAYPGGDRDRWERSLFAGAYQAESVQPCDRPKYGALNVMRYADGASPRFGSCHFRLKAGVLDRCTFTCGDSHAQPEHAGTRKVFMPVLAALLEEVRTTGSALASDVPGAGAFAARCLSAAEPASKDGLPGPGAIGGIGRALDAYIEAQIHGAIRLESDVDALVADPSFQGTATGAQLGALCEAYGIPLYWHPGFRLAAGSVPEDFRGPVMPPLARRVAASFGAGAASPDVFDAAAIGRAAASLHRQPEAWADFGTPAEVLQYLKQLWHVLVRYG